MSYTDLQLRIIDKMNDNKLIAETSLPHRAKTASELLGRSAMRRDWFMASSCLSSDMRVVVPELSPLPCLLKQAMKTER